jgi:predicted RNA binding protein YcfA (HicA-like mRNA interferase family)
MKASALVKLLEKHGWKVDRQSGSHKTLKHPTNPVLITVPIHTGDIKKGLLKRLLKIAGL